MIVIIMYMILMSVILVAISCVVYPEESVVYDCFKEKYIYIPSRLDQMISLMIKAGL